MFTFAVPCLAIASICFIRGFEKYFSSICVFHLLYNAFDHVQVFHLTTVSQTIDNGKKDKIL